MAYNNYLTSPYNNGMSNPQYAIPAISDRINTLQGYSPYQYGNMNPMPMQQGMQPSPSQQDIPFVDGYEGAKLYPIPVGKKLLLMDSKDSKFYIKEIDPQGYPIIQSFRFEPLVGNAPNPEKEDSSESSPQEKVDFVDKSQFDDLKQDYINFKNTVVALVSQYQNTQPQQAPAVVSEPVEKGNSDKKGGK